MKSAIVAEVVFQTKARQTFRLVEMTHINSWNRLCFDGHK